MKTITDEEYEELIEWRKWEKILLEHPEWKLQSFPFFFALRYKTGLSVHTSNAEGGLIWKKNYMNC